MQFVPEKHYALLCDWSRGWGIEPPAPEDLPARGWLMDGCLFGFLAVADGRLGVAHNLVSDPAASRFKVVRAGLLMHEQILASAEYVGLRKVCCTTSHKSVTKLALANGWKPVTQYLYLEKAI